MRRLRVHDKKGSHKYTEREGDPVDSAQRIQNALKQN
jgi:hypothetical protein